MSEGPWERALAALEGMGCLAAIAASLIAPVALIYGAVRLVLWFLGV